MRRYLIFIFLSFFIFIQQNQAQKGFEVGMNLGTAHYFGDLNSQFNFKEAGLSISAYGRYNIDHRISARLNFTYGRIKADDKNSENIFQRQRNLNFYSNVFDAAALIEFNFLPYFHGSKDQYFTPYVFAGLAAFHHNPKTELDGTVYKLKDFGTEGQAALEEYNSIQPALAFGLGLKWDIDYYWSINAEFSSRRLFTDYIDDVSTVYPNKTDLEDLRGPIAVALTDRSIPDAGGQQLGEEGTQRGNSKNNDSYSFLQVGVAYYFGRVACPPISRFRSQW